MPCAQLCVCHSLVNPAKYFIFINGVEGARKERA